MASGAAILWQNTAFSLLHFWVGNVNNSYSAVTNMHKETGTTSANVNWKWQSSQTAKFGALRKYSAHLPSLPLLVGHIRVLFAIVIVNAVHGRPVAVQPVKQSLPLLPFQFPDR